MFTGVENELLLGLFAQFLQRLKLIEQRLGPKARRFVCELGQPLAAPIGAINRAARIKPTPAIDCLYAILRTRRILNQIFIGSTKLFELLLIVIAFVDSLHRSD